MGKSKSNLFTRFVVLVVLGATFYQILLPMVGNTWKIHQYSIQSERIQNSPIVTGTIISDRTVYTDLQVIPRIYKNKIVRGHRILAQGVGKNGKIDFVKVEFWGPSSAFTPMSKVEYKVDPILGEIAEISNSSLYSKSFANLTILLTVLVGIFLLFLMHITILVPTRWSNFSPLGRSFTMFTPIVLGVLIFCLSRYLFLTT